MSTPSGTPAGWYPDAEQPGGQRYWDGIAWTEHRVPAQPAAAPEPPIATPAPITSAPTAAPTTSAPAYGAPVATAPVTPTYGMVGPPKRKGRGCLIAVLAVVGLIVLVVVIAAISGGKSGSSSAPSSPGATADGGTQAAGLNTPVRDGSFEFVVTKSKCGVTSVGTSLLSRKPQGQFCLVTMTVKNIGDKAQLFDASSQKGFSPSGAQYDADGAASLYANKNAETFLTNINPGNSVTGVVVFDIPKAEKLAAVELHDSPFSGGIKVTL